MPMQWQEFQNSPDLSSATTNVRKEGVNVLQSLKVNNCKPEMLYAEAISFKTDR